jgi:hypothetical protein
MSGVQMTDYTVHTQRALLCCARVWIEARRHWNAMMLSAQLSWLLGSTIDSFHLTTSPGVHSLSPLLLLEQRPIERCLTSRPVVVSCTLLVQRQISLSRSRHCLYINKLAGFQARPRPSPTYPHIS